MALLLNDALSEADVKRWIERFRLDEGLSTYSNANVLKKALPDSKIFLAGRSLMTA